MERRVEAAEQRQLRLGLGDSVDGRPIVRLIQRRQRDLGIECRQHIRFDAHRSSEAQSAMDNPMTNGTDHVIH